ncbi:uncharacterized protein At4g28440-like [Camellia sinensis]|uniref:uncharacterized protein At4g28440-like n=1 Tax=Camellia sinensis TaxID=4442 RepID=UPI001035E372|nr:uncharacterized protein At4g28440-like [Camellia sinensis]
MGNRYYRFPKALKTFTSSSNVLQMAEAKSAIRKPVFNKVDQLRPGTGGHNLILKVVSSKTVLQKGRPDGPQVPLIFLDLMKPDGTVILRNAKIDMFKGSMRLAVDKWGRVEVTEPASFTVKDDNNLSLLKLVICYRKVPSEEQIKDLLRKKNFEEAISLVEELQSKHI